VNQEAAGRPRELAAESNCSGQLPGPRMQHKRVKHTITDMTQFVNYRVRTYLEYFNKKVHVIVGRTRRDLVRDGGALRHHAVLQMGEPTAALREEDR
jgi:hypothetical protein